MEKPKFYPSKINLHPLNFLKIKLRLRKYLVDIYLMPNFVAISSRAACPQICEIYWYCDVLLYLYFFHGCAQLNPSMDLTYASSHFWGVLMATHNFNGFKPPKSQIANVVRHFLPSWQNHKIAISPTANIGSTPKF